MKRALAFIVLGLVALLAVVAGAVAAWVWDNLPATDTEIAVPGVQQPISVIRDEAGVPHIFAKSAKDAYFALGFVHAQDRFWQMEMTRRTGAGTLAEILGPEAVTSDKWMRTLGVYASAARQFAALSAPVREALERYAAGVNARLERASRFAWRYPAPEFALLGYRPEPWKPADSLVWGKLMAMRLGGNWRDEILRARLARKLAPVQVGEMWPRYPDDAPASIEKAEALLGTIDLDRLAAVDPLPTGLPRGASNAWVMGGTRTENRHPILANDPHLGFGAPVLWYLARIDAPDLKVTGATVPGVPFTVLGHNDDIAWGITNTQSDLQDLFVEQLDDEGKRYQSPAGMRVIKGREVTFNVKGAAPVTFMVRETRHGPIISDLDPEIAKVAGGGAAIALKATFLETSDSTPEAFYGVNRAKDWESFVAALKNFHAPQQNFLFAAKNGDIGFIAPGLVPIRKHGWGLVPSPGWDGATDWDGFVPFEELPMVHNPPSARIVNANNRITTDDYPYFISFDWAPAYRARRILERLGEGRQTVQGTARLQQDHVSAMAQHLLPMMLDIEPQDGLGKRVHAMLGKWNGAMSRRRPEPLIFSTWLLELNRALYADELGDLFAAYLTLRPQFVELALSQRPKWCDNVNTAETEDCKGRIAFALKRATDQLTAARGPEPRDWLWGDVHKAYFGNPVLNTLPFVREHVDLEIETNGGNYTINRGASRISDPKHPFRHIHGPGYRAVYDLEDLRRSRFVIATGQSGIVFSSHYRDMLESWRDGRYVRLGHTHDILNNTAPSTLLLTPAPSEG